ncbi:protoporphyrinogen oxidase [Nocardia sp. 348MFTsu5.1]|uniref:protoporphyrinogen oxidase n=1 Tax=Nocardia sp. 348MFTsu5.1 TaxID=1172185 RepID=UPI000372B7A4|nr:protoporphyrinogen oxidase [Nocardia sp. 348MFTsu5.1]
MNALRLAVIGGGISGLSAAYRLRALLGQTAVIDLYEATDRLGGTLKGVDLAGTQLDVGAEAFLVRRPEVPALLTELGIASRMVHPGTLGPRILARGALEPMARPTLMGIPADPAVVAHLAEPADLALMTDEPRRPLEWIPGQDVSIGGLVAERFGRSVVDRSVDPMLSGVYSARADDLGLRAVLPALAARLDVGSSSLTAAVADLIGAASGDGPIFGAMAGGYQELVDTLVERSAATTHTGTIVTDIRRGDEGWLVDGTAYDGVVCALTAPAAARVLDSEPGVARPLSGVDISGSAVVAMAFGPDVVLPELSGVLVASDETVVRAKAFTFSSQKWPHLAGNGALVRASFGRFGAPVSDIDDDQLIDWATSDLSTVIGIWGGRGGLTPVDAVVQRWPAGLPRYGTGHADLVAELDSGRPRGLALAGATYNGVGVPACVGRAERAARQLVADLTD